MTSTAASPKVYVHPGCTVRHRSWNTHTACRLPRNIWVMGEGPIALLAWCDVLTISLHPDRETAQGAREWIDKTGCGHACVRHHDIVDLREATS